MKNRFFVNADFAAGQRIDLKDEEVHHARVLRVREGEAVEVFNGRGVAFDATFEPPGTVVMKSAIDSRERATPIHLAMSIINLEKFELVLQKATELGVASITPIESDRGEIRPERYKGKMDRWKKIIFEATKQSGRSRIATLADPLPFLEAIARPGLKVLFDADTPPCDAVSGEATLFIGPEGGWSEEELDAARKAGFVFQQLGPRRLRAETAAIVAVALASLR